jgi:LmbE family N-acetylglucosaminyl deacetylase
MRESHHNQHEILARLGGARLPAAIDVRALVVAAHPDDEIIGVGARLARWPTADVVYTTDGAPNDLRDAWALGISSRNEYASLRRTERGRALAVANVTTDRVHDLGRVDGEATRDLVGLTAELYAMLCAAKPEVVVTHPYEGGHPDHDATAFAVHAAVGQLARADAATPVIVEMTSYHIEQGGLVTGCFLPSAHRHAESTPLSAQEQSLKQQMLGCHASQQKVLRPFRIDIEPIRVAPVYDFVEPPHEGRLFYECFPWWTTGPEWRGRARAALRSLGIAQRGGLLS